MRNFVKNVVKIFALFTLLQTLASCAYMLNEKTVAVTINSSPPGADIIINGRSYGQTPRTLRIIPENHEVTLHKAGYGVAKIQLETWQAVREDKTEGGRCIADALGTMFVIPAFSYWSVYCRDFKQKEYSVTLPYSGPRGSVPNSYYKRSDSNGGYGGYNNNSRTNYQQNNHNVLGGGEYYENRTYTDDSFGNPGSGF